MSRHPLHPAIFLEGLSGAAAISMHMLLPALRPRRVRWGASDDETQADLPGDGLVPAPRWSYTHGIDIDAPVGDVWPWLVQMGQGRGGFYSYEWLENLLGCRISNADEILPACQSLKVGDGIRLHARMPGVPVAILEPERAIVLHVRVDTDTGRTFDPELRVPERYVNCTWAFVLVEQCERSRLLTRWRADYDPSVSKRMWFGPSFMEPISFVMERKMLREIKKRVELARLATGE